MKLNKQLKKILNPYSLAIVGSIILIIVSLFIIFKPETKKTPAGIEIVDTGIKEEEEITEQEARKVAKKQFQKLGESSVKEEELQVKKIRRSEEEYYYISSAKNTLEIKIKGGEITRINSATVEE
ncbi:MAG: hypothetical protein J6A04_03450 [Clostridia bacterium]|nr:hypothetical protein [Clostridia bacterium]